MPSRVRRAAADSIPLSESGPAAAGPCGLHCASSRWFGALWTRPRSVVPAHYSSVMCSEGSAVASVAATIDALSAQDLAGVSELALAADLDEFQRQVQRLEAQCLRHPVPATPRGLRPPGRDRRPRLDGWLAAVQDLVGLRAPRTSACRSLVRWPTGCPQPPRRCQRATSSTDMPPPCSSTEAPTYQHPPSRTHRPIATTSSCRNAGGRPSPGTVECREAG